MSGSLNNPVAAPDTRLAADDGTARCQPIMVRPLRPHFTLGLPVKPVSSAADHQEPQQ